MVNDLGVDPYEWFDNPLDRMPIATDTPLSTNRYAPPEKMIELEENPRPEEEIADDWFETDTYASRHESTPEFEKELHVDIDHAHIDDIGEIHGDVVTHPKQF